MVPRWDACSCPWHAHSDQQKFVSLVKHNMQALEADVSALESQQSPLTSMLQTLGLVRSCRVGLEALYFRGSEVPSCRQLCAFCWRSFHRAHPRHRKRKSSRV
jgi:hypothetical protein